jgi:aminopeptidase N
MLKLNIKQTQTVDELTPCFVTPVDLALTLPVDDGSRETRTINLKVTVGADGQVEQSFYFPLEREPLMIRFDPDGWLLKTLKFERPSGMLRYQLENDPDILGRIEAAEALGERKDPENIAALTRALNNDAFWGVRNTAAAALSTISGEQAQAVLINALQALDPEQFSRVRTAIATALGSYQAPAQATLAQNSANVLRAVLEKGDVSYHVEKAAATALGKTRTEGSVDFLAKLLDRPSWMNTVQMSIFTGLASTGEDRVVDLIAGYLNNANNHPTLRRAAGAGLWTLGHQRNLYSEEVRQRAVTALCVAVENDIWGPTRMISALALQTLGEPRAISSLERAAKSELDDGVLRRLRVASHALRTGDKSEEQLKSLRKDLDELREENRTLKDKLSAIEARLK